MEMLALFNEKEEFINKYIMRGLTPDDGEYIMITYLFIINDDKVLLEKDINTNLWVVPGGHVNSSFIKANLIREIDEELGIDISNYNIYPIETINKNNRLFKLHYILEKIDLSDIIIDVNEVAEVGYFTIDEIDKLIYEGKFKDNNVMFIDSLKKVRIVNNE